MNVPVLSLHSTFNGGKWLVVLEAQINASIKGQAYLLDLHLAMFFVSLYVLTSPLVYLVQNRNSKVWMDQLLDFTCSWGLGEELSFYWLQSCLIYVKIIILLSSKKSFCIQNRTTAKYNVMLFPQRAFGFGDFSLAIIHLVFKSSSMKYTGSQVMLGQLELSHSFVEKSLSSQRSPSGDGNKAQPCGTLLNRGSCHHKQKQKSSKLLVCS